MEKKTKIRTRFMAGALALILSGMPSLALAKKFYSEKKLL